jgi:predicted dehydrogenase
MRIAVAGTGLRPAHVLQTIMRQDPAAQVVGYFDPQPTFLDQIGEGIPGFASVAEMLDRTQPDLFFVGSPNVYHLDQIREGLERGIRVFTEKPVVTTIEDTFALAELLARHGPDRVIVGLVLRHSQHMRDLRAAMAAGVLGRVVSLEANEHIAPYHGSFFMRDWRRMVAWSGGFMLEKCCHDIDLYNMVTGSRPVRIASFGGRKSYVPENAPTSNAENEIMHVKPSVWNSVNDAFHSDGDIIDYQTAILSYEAGSSLAFHTNLNTPDEHRRFCVMGTHGMAEGDFVRGFLKVTLRDGTVWADHNYGDPHVAGSHYGADDLMVGDILAFLKGEIAALPVGVVDALEAGIACMAMDEARITGRIVDLTEVWARFDSYRLRG